MFFLLKRSIIERNKKIIDYNALFNLKSDPILTFNEVVKIDPITEMMKGITLRHLQKQVNSLQLIPTVPQDVRRVFNHAKKLFIFGYFNYGFFTISEHYGYLALESAIRHRYNQSLGEKAVIKNPQREVIELKPSWYAIYNLCNRNRKKWNKTKITVNEEDFPFKSSLLLNWLVEKKIITKWERKQYDVGINMRNILSHLEFAPIHMPNSFALNYIAEQINTLFYRDMHAC
jgi:hypothetical protein